MVVPSVHIILPLKLVKPFQVFAVRVSSTPSSIVKEVEAVPSSDTIATSWSPADNAAEYSSSKVTIVLPSVTV